ncbi:IDEAL domain-containing protein [Gracilibacillus orientalis]|uniref:IDEAL domain-containing protein n=1 Tax=Gracilibacillus orientalis TaxID=334253 RepID=A0A1I4K336_9BACI|nr:IDEAL domain-containing protein [Gracilibacillus orientalis]SFL73109.1 IDEAL domain-containing protein [Gracilibacillus orientalis]
MNRDFIVVQSFSHLIDCFCPGSIHTEVLRVEQADIIRVTNERKYIVHNGWYCKAIVDDHYYFYIALEDLEHYYTKGQILAMEDIELNLNYLNFQIDQALDNKDESNFKLFSKQLMEVNQLKVKLEKHLDADKLFYI